MILHRKYGPADVSCSNLYDRQFYKLFGVPARDDILE
jgi:hypothetical protein